MNSGYIVEQPSRTLDGEIAIGVKGTDYDDFVPRRNNLKS